MSTATATAPAMDVKRYRRLLSRTLPKAIKTEQENRARLKIVHDLILRGDDKRTREENALLDLLVTLVEAFEREHYPIASERSTPREMLKYLMESNDLKPADIAKIIGSRARASEILSGKRAISKAQARKLGERFHVSPALFL